MGAGGGLLPCQPETLDNGRGLVWKRFVGQRMGKTDEETAGETERHPACSQFGSRVAESL